MKSTLLTAIAALTLLPMLAQAAESYGNYDTLSTPLLSAEKWQQRERTRLLEGNALRIIQRDIGDQVSNTGKLQSTYALNMVNPDLVTQMQATVKVNAFEVTHCASNGDTEPSDVQARLIGSFFNAGPVTPGSRVNDILALVRLIRTSTSADAAGVLRAEGLMVRCTTSDCGSSELVGSIADLGTVPTGSTVTLRMLWDADVNKFYFQRDSTKVSITYALSDALPPVVGFKQVGNRTRLANCLAGTATTGLMDATYDTIYVNASAAP